MQILEYYKKFSHFYDINAEEDLTFSNLEENEI